MIENVTSVEAVSPIYWPWFVAGLLSVPVSSLLANWLPPYIAEGLTFFILFAAASSIVARWSRPSQTQFGRNVAASAVGAIIAMLLEYVFP